MADNYLQVPSLLTEHPIVVMTLKLVGSQAGGALEECPRLLHVAFPHLQHSWGSGAGVLPVTANLGRHITKIGVVRLN